MTTYFPLYPYDVIKNIMSFFKVMSEIIFLISLSLLELISIFSLLHFYL